MAIHVVEITKLAKKNLENIPIYVADKLLAWVRRVEQVGVEKVRKIPGYHDEPLRGGRKNQRSIRLSRSYRAIYEVKNNGRIEFICIIEVSKHGY